jgi:hypothetical protein
MKILRSVTRRGFNVGTAGYFSVLKSNAWFPASRLPDSPYHLADRYIGTAKPDSEEPAIPPQIIAPGARQPFSLQLALVVTTAAVITSVLLWWIIRA